MSIQSIILHQLRGDQLFRKCIFMLLAYISEILRSFSFFVHKWSRRKAVPMAELPLKNFLLKKRMGRKKTELCKQLILL